MRVVLVGHLDPRAGESAGFTDARLLAQPIPADALVQVAQGMAEAQPGWDVCTVPWGPGPVFVEALRGIDGDPWLVAAGRDGAEWAERVGAGPLVVEMGHDQKHDGGRRVLERLEPHLDGRSVVVAASTSRPLVGPAGTALLAPDLRPRANAGIPAAGANGTLPGSGAGGGAAALLADRGAQLRPTGEVLADFLELDRLLEGADLVVLAHLFWHSPDLADAPVMVVAEAAAMRCVPAVGVGVASSLSAVELAESGLQGVHLRRPGRTWDDVGRRIGRTWGANYAS